MRPTGSANRRIQPRLAGCAAAALTLALGACSPSTSAPSPPAPPPPVPPIRVEPVSPVYGTAYEHTHGRPRPLPGLALRVHGRRNGMWLDIDVTTDASGRYEVTDMSREYILVGVLPQNEFLSPCSWRDWDWGDGPVDIHVVARSTVLTGVPDSLRQFTSFFPNVFAFSGVVAEVTENGLRPIEGALVEHFYGTISSVPSGVPMGFTLTNAAGEYALCSYFDDYGQVARVSKTGYQTVVQWVPYGKLNVNLLPN
jgi:hypothetical protein